MRTCTGSRYLCIIVFACLLHFNGIAQEPASASDENSHHRLQKNISIPQLYRAPVEAALVHFPELAQTRIHVRIRHQYTPLSTRPSWFNIFRRGDKRLYIITISDKTISRLEPILFNQLSYEAQIGVAGHELSHVADFRRRNFFSLLRVGWGNFSSRYLDRLEYKTDSICIQHGLATNLLAWSQFVRNALHVKNWRGANNIGERQPGKERYMNPETIEAIIKKGQTRL